MTSKIQSVASAIKKRRVPIVLLVLLIGGGIAAILLWGKKSGDGAFFTAKLERGTVETDVTATGTVQAVTTVQVGSQVSGTVSWLGADYKSRVKSGQVIAKLDPAIFQAQLDTAKANLVNSQAAVQAADTDVKNQEANIVAAQANADALKVQAADAWDVVKRDREITNVIATRDLQAAEALAKAADARFAQAQAQIGQANAALASSKAKLEQAKAGVAQSKAGVDLAQVNVDHCVIASPIDGVVVSRSVDVGQTVAASLAAPTLFTIANDLKNMQVLADIDEADVGQIREGIPANFSVDAFTGLNFTGKISQIRLNAQNTQNVVTYTTVIDVQNPEEKLLPGMTANITIPVAKHENVLTVPNAALRFKPNLSDKDQKELQAKIDDLRKQYQSMRQAQPGASPETGQPGGQPSAEAGVPPSYRGQQGQGPSQSGQGAGGGQQPGQGGGPRGGGSGGGGGSGHGQNAGGGTKPGGAQMIYVVDSMGKLQPVFVRVGITNGRVTEVTGKDLQEGQTIAIGQTDAGGQQQQNSPFGRRGIGK